MLLLACKAPALNNELHAITFHESMPRLSRQLARLYKVFIILLGLVIAIPAGAAPATAPGATLTLPPVALVLLQLEQSPRQPEALFAMAQWLAATGHPVEALDYAERAQRYAPRPLTGLEAFLTDQRRRLGIGSY